jgi:hypothetical protein
LAHSGEVAVALLDAVDESLLVPGELMTTTIRECIERCPPPRPEQIPTELETCQRALEELPSACACLDFRKLVVWNVRSSLAVNFAEHDDWTPVDYVNHAKEAKRND